MFVIFNENIDTDKFGIAVKFCIVLQTNKKSLTFYQYFDAYSYFNIQLELKKKGYYFDLQILSSDPRFVRMAAPFFSAPFQPFVYQVLYIYDSSSNSF